MEFSSRYTENSFTIINYLNEIKLFDILKFSDMSDVIALKQTSKLMNELVNIKLIAKYIKALNPNDKPKLIINIWHYYLKIDE